MAGKVDGLGGLQERAETSKTLGALIERAKERDQAEFGLAAAIRRTHAAVSGLSSRETDGNE
jgi:hypothetical protein